MEEVLKDILFQNHVYLFLSQFDKYNPNIDLHTIFLVEINKYNLKIWANMTYSVIFLTLKSVIYGHYVLRTDFGRSYHKCCSKTT